MKVINTLIAFLLLIIPVFLPAQQLTRIVKTGLEVLKENRFEALKNQRVGLITNPTGVDVLWKSTIDILHEAPGVDLVALFGPEHGVRGNHAAGERIGNTRDPITGLPMFSLYGKTRKPTPEMLEGIDVLVYDIQDIGVRSYTYIGTMGLAMEAAAENDIEFVVLDRPNPLGGWKIEGNLAEEAQFSLVGAYPIPYVYGLTVGELATMINEEGWLKNGKKCKLTVIPMKGWYRSLYFEDTDLPWVPSSPHIPHAHKAQYYVASGILGELNFFNIGVGYTLPFELFGIEFLNPHLLVPSLNEAFGEDVQFRPVTYQPFYGSKSGQLLHGIQFQVRNPELVNLMSIQFKFLEAFHKIYPNVDVLAETTERHAMFDKVCGSAQVRELFFKNYKYRDVEAFLNKDVEAFREKAEKYYLYN